MYLKKDHIHSWKDHKQYKYNIDFTPNRMKMQNMAKGDDWIFKEYAQPRREIISQIKPPYSEKDLATVFVDTLEYPFYEKMVRISWLIFSDLVTIWERVEMSIKLGRIIDSPSKAIKVKNPRSKEPEEEDLDDVNHD